MSAIDITKPVTGNPTTQSVRDNFAAAHAEITALQSSIDDFLPLTGGALSGGLSFGSVNASGITDLSKHIALWGTTYGFGVDNAVNALNYLVPVTARHRMVVGSLVVGLFDTTGMNQTIIGATTSAAGSFNTLIAGKSSANNITLAGSATQVPATISATGTDADIDLTVTGKGIGYTRFPRAIVQGGLMDGVAIGAIGGIAQDYSLDLDFLHGVQDARLTFTRASAATYFDAAGAIQTAANNVLRFDYDPVTLAARGVLIEETRTNYLFNAAAPVSQTVTLGAAGTYILWVVGSGSATTSAGTAAATGYGAATAGTPNVFTTTSTGNVVVTVTGSLTRFQLERCASGTQVFPTSFIPTAGALATRATELLTIPLTGWFSPTPVGTMMVEALKLTATGTNGTLFSLNRASPGDRIALNTNTSGSVAMFLSNAGVPAGAINTSVAPEPLGAPYRAVFAFTAGAQSGVVNAGTLKSGVGTPTSVIDTSSIGTTATGLAAHNGWIRRVRFWQRVLTPTEVLQASRPATLTNTRIDNCPMGDDLPHRGTFTSLKVGSITGPTWTIGTGVPASVQPRGSLYSRTDGAAGSTLYVSQGGGTWNPVSAV